MSNSPSQLLKCKRCGEMTAVTMAESPIEGKWTLYSCGKCCFIWRSTEELRGDEFLDGIYKLNNEQIKSLTRSEFAID